MKKLFERYKFFIIGIVFILLVGFYIFSPVKITIKKLANSVYALKYDNTWKVKEKSKNNITLKHHSGSVIKIAISSLNDEYSYSSIDELIDEILYSVQKQNKNYKLLFKKSKKITKYEFDGYEVLYENKDAQVMLNIYKKSDKIVIISYEAKNTYFDILLDSVENIIYNLDIKDKSFNAKSSINLKTSNISYNKSNNVDSLLKNTETYELANNNYYVKYSIPDNFKVTSLDSQSGNFDFSMEDEKKVTKHIYLDTSVLNVNIYDYFDKDNVGSVYKSYEAYKNGKDYSEFKENISLLDSDYESYIYKNSYYYDKAMIFDNVNFTYEKGKEANENVELIYALNNNHIFIVKMRSAGMPITEKLVDMIKINSSKNYSSFIKIEKENGNLMGRLQRFTDYKHDKVDKITIKVPDKYEEIDKGGNLYLQRDYVLNYNEDLLIYDYDVRYELSDQSSKEKIIDDFNSFGIVKSYGDYEELTYYTDLTLNDKKFSVYTGGYTNLSGIMFTNINRVEYYVNKMVLIYELPNKGCLLIEISGNGKEVNNDMLEELTNFIVEYN